MHRIALSSIVVGLVLLVASLGDSNYFGFGGDVAYGEYEGVLFRAVGDFQLDIATENGSRVSIYILDYSEALTLIREGSMENVTPAVWLENISGYSAIVGVWVPSWYGIIVTPYNNQTVVIDVNIQQIVPQRGVFALGLILICVGLIAVISRRVHSSGS